MKKFFIFNLALFISTFLYAQNNVFDNRPYIEVIGTAQLEIIPNEIYISISLKERQEGKENLSIADQEKNLFSAMKTNTK